jgi:predicted PurR-regulated permease PerM
MVAPEKKGWKFVKLNQFRVMVGSLVRFEVLGLIGLFVGPVVLALCGEVSREWVPDARWAASSSSDRMPTVR